MERSGLACKSWNFQKLGTLFGALLQISGETSFKKGLNICYVIPLGKKLYLDNLNEGLYKS